MPRQTLRDRVEDALTDLGDLLDDDGPFSWTEEGLDEIRVRVEEAYEALGGEIVRRAVRPNLDQIPAA